MLRALRLLREEIQRVRIPHRRSGQRRDAPVQRTRPVGLAETRAESHDVGPLQQRLEVIRVGNGVRHEFGARCDQQGGV